MKGFKQKLGLVSAIVLAMTLFYTLTIMPTGTLLANSNSKAFSVATATSSGITTQEDGESTLKQFDVRIDPYPVYIKYSKNVDDYDNIPEYFVIENDEIVYSRTEPGEYNKNRYRYNIRLSYSYIPYSRTETGEKYANPWFNAGKGFYDLKITATDGNGEFEPYEIYIENFFIVQDEEGLTIPTFSAEYTGEHQTATIPNDAKYTVVSNNGGINVGQYEVTLKLKNTTVFHWEGLDDATQDTITTTFNITKATTNNISGLRITPWNYGEYNENVNKPSAVSTIGNIVYTYYNSSGNQVEDIANAKPGTYTLEAKVEETSNYVGATASVQFEIAKKGVSKPERNQSFFTYNGAKQTYTLVENSAYTISNNIQTNAGKYTVTVSLIDTDIYEWTDHTTNPLTFDFIIEKLSVTSPIINSKEYNGKTQTADVAKSPLYNLETGSNMGGINAGFYDVALILVDHVNYRWDADLDGQNQKLTLQFEIKKATSNYINDLNILNWQYGEHNSTLNAPTAVSAFGTVLYSYLNSAGEIVDDIASAPAGQYTLVAKVNETDNFVGSTNSITFSILKKQISGVWVSKSGHTYFKLDNQADADKFSVRYYDKNGVEVDFDDLANGKEYTVKIILNDYNNYELVTTKNGTLVAADYEKSFVFDNITFFEKYWYIFALGGTLLIAVIVTLIIITKKRKNNNNPKTTN